MHFIAGLWPLGSKAIDVPFDDGSVHRLAFESNCFARGSCGVDLGHLREDTQVEGAFCHYWSDANLLYTVIYPPEQPGRAWSFLQTAATFCGPRYGGSQFAISPESPIIESHVAEDGTRVVTAAKIEFVTICSVSTNTEARAWIDVLDFDEQYLPGLVPANWYQDRRIFQAAWEKRLCPAR